MLSLSVSGWAKPPGDPGDGRKTVELTLASGDTLFGLLGPGDLQAVNRAAVMQAVNEVYDSRRLRPGDKVLLTIEPQRDGTLVRSLHLETGRGADLTIDVDAGASPDRRALAAADGLPHRLSGLAGPSFRATLQRLALPKPLIEDIMAALGRDPDMPPSPPAGSHFTIFYETLPPSAGGVESELKFIAIDDGHKVHRIYRYPVGDGNPAYVQDDGHGVALIRLGQPLRIKEIVTSPYGWRIHPVFGDRRFHKGVDYGAPTGTPVLAAADGTVGDVGWRGNYGRYIRVDHGTGLATAYAHLSRFAKGLAAGQHVRQGQVIGYVGQTGVATGPHLYYEVIVGGKRVDPLNLPDAVSVRLEGPSLAGFQRYTQALRQEASLY
jgi:murein DD-endopeptidase MepM/ murein hydrolase activator NlpD